MSLTVALMLMSLVSASLQELSTIKVKTGQNALLQCHGPRHAPISLLEWIRPDLDSDDYVFFYRDRRLYENYQHSSFKTRVELRDPQMKDGDVSVVLKNVTNEDSGTYLCLVSVRKTSRHNRALPDFSKTLELLVEDSGHADRLAAGAGDARGHAELRLMLVVVAAATFGII